MAREATGNMTAGGKTNQEGPSMSHATKTIAGPCKGATAGNPLKGGTGINRATAGKA